MKHEIEFWIVLFFLISFQLFAVVVLVELYSRVVAHAIEVENFIFSDGNRRIVTNKNQ